MNTARIKIRLSLVAAAMTTLLITGCAAVGPDYQAPQIPTPDAWTVQVSDQVDSGSQASLQTWWTVFNDPVLDSLIERARLANLDLAIAVSRVSQSRSRLAIAQGGKQPEATAGGSAQVSKPADDGALEPLAPADGFKSSGLYQAGIDASWEIDVFGRVRRSIEAAGAAYQASIEDYRDVMITLYADVALTYVDIRGLQQRIVYAQQNTASQRESLNLAQDRFDSGIVSRLDVVQAQGSLSTTQAVVPDLQLSLQQAINRLAILLGQQAGSLQAEFSSPGPLPKIGSFVGIGVPADVLRQRPDIRSAERLLAAQTAEIGVATADLYPSFSLGGFFGLQTRSLSNLFSSSALTYGLSSPVQWSIFNGGRVRANIDLQSEIAQQDLLIYKNNVLVAIGEVEDAIAAYELNGVRQSHLQVAESAISESENLVLVQYNTGLTNFNNVMTTQRDLFSLQDQLVTNEAGVLASLVTLYKALGGGWDLNDTAVLAND